MWEGVTRRVTSQFELLDSKFDGEIAELKGELKGEIADLNTKLDTILASLKTSIASESNCHCH